MNEFARSHRCVKRMECARARASARRAVRSTWDEIAVEQNVAVMSGGLVRNELHFVDTVSDRVDVVGNVPSGMVDANLEITLTCQGCID